MVSALSVGNTILKRGQAEGREITPMKLQKLIYIVYKEYYKRTDSALFPERFEVWKYGPVIQSIYDTFKEFGANAIKKMGISSDGYVYVVNEDASSIFKEVLDNVWDKYKKYDGIRLSEMTHRQNTAWYKAAIAHKPFLSDEDIKGEADFVE